MWFQYPEKMELKQADIFRIFPKDLITLPSKAYVNNQKKEDLWEI